MTVFGALGKLCGRLFFLHAYVYPIIRGMQIRGVFCREYISLNVRIVYFLCEESFKEIVIINNVFSGK